MWKNQKGVLTVEASLSLGVFFLVVLFLFNFATVYRAENMVSHATLQTADAVALESYLRETTFEGDNNQVLFWANRLNGSETVSEDAFESLRSADLISIAKEKFTLAIKDTATDADSVLKSLGVERGLNGIDLSQSYVDFTTNDVIIKADYVLNLRFPVFGFRELTVSKAAKAKTAGEILFGLNVIPEQEIMGTTKGSGKYKMGTEVQISATPNYGFDFVCWDDGNTQNPRTVKVANAQTFVAKFERHAFGVNLFISDPASPDGKTRGSNAYGKVTSTVGGNSSVGGSEYPYEANVTIAATANPGYTFQSWSGSKLTDAGLQSVYSNSASFQGVVDGVYDVTAVFKPNVYSVSVSTFCEAAKGSIGVRKFGGSLYQSSVSLEYGNAIELKANNINGYTFQGWYKNGKQVAATNYAKMPLPIGGGSYEARYEKDPIVTVLVKGAGSAYVNGQTTYSCKKGTSVNLTAVANSGHYFAKWNDNSTLANRWVTVNKDVTYTANFGTLYTVRVISGGNGTATGGGVNLKSGSTTTLKASPASGHQFSKWQKSVDGKNYYDVSWSASYSPVVDGNATYKAIFTKKTYTVSFNVNGGAVAIGSWTVEHGKTVSGFPTPVPGGKQFVEWQLNGKKCTSVTVTSNITLVAKWKGCSGHVWGHCGKRHYMSPSPQWFGITKYHIPKSGHYRYWNACQVCVRCGTVGSRYCGTCTSWKSKQWVNIHGLGSMDNINSVK